MKIVLWHKGDNFEHLSTLSSEETELLHEYWRLKPADRSLSLRKDVGNILRNIHDRKAWLECDCGTGAMMHPAIHGGVHLKLVRMPDRKAHGERKGERCSFQWAEGELGGSSRAGSCGLVSKLPEKPNFLIFSAETPIAVKGGGVGGGGHTRKGGKNALQQYLFWMLREAKMHLYSTPLALKSVIPQFRSILSSVPLVNNISLSKIVWCTYRAIAEGWVVSCFAQLRENSAWPKDRPPQGFLVLVACEVDRELRSFVDKDGNRLSIDGEFSVYGRQGRNSGPYLAIVSMCERDGKVVFSRAYLHPVIAENNWLPVDSGFEREAFSVIASFLSGVNKESPRRYELTKPLEDIEVGEKGCRPDFVIQDSVSQRILLIETMGASDQEYRDRKDRSHELMKQLGPVFLDERINHGVEDANESLRKALWRWYYNRR